MLLAAPATLAVLAVIGWPAVQTIIYSFEKVQLNGPDKLIGFANFTRLFADSDFRHSLVLTVEYAVGFLVVSTVLGLVFALLLNEHFPGRWIARTLLIIPWASPWIIVGIMWKWFLDADVGALNGLLYQVGAIHGYHAYLANETESLGAVIIAASWRQASLSGLLFLAGLQTIPAELWEAARVDGASAWGRFRDITLPWLRPVLVVVTVINIIIGFMQFDLVYAMTQGGPGDATTLLSILLYRQLFLFTDFGYGSAIAVVLGLIALGFGLLFVKLLYRSEPALATR